MSDSKRHILAAVARSRYGNGDALGIEDALREIGPAPRPELAEEQRLERFLSRLKINNVTVDVAESRSDAVKRIAHILYTEHHTHRVVAGNDSRLAALPWRDGGVLVRFGVATAQDPVSISYARFGIAETGSLALYDNRDNPAANNWLPQDHIVVLDGNDLVSHLEDAWTGIRAERASRRMPRGVTFISGPSSTGDIAGQIVTGAHGPQRLHLVYLGRVPDELLERTGHKPLTP